MSELTIKDHSLQDMTLQKAQSSMETPKEIVRPDELLAGLSYLEGWHWFKDMTILDEPLPVKPLRGKKYSEIKPVSVAEDASLAPFQRLPAELVMMIYEYTQMLHRVCIVAHPGKRKRRKAMRYTIKHLMVDYRIPESQQIVKDDLIESECLPIGLMLSCRKFYLDIMPSVYGNTQFKFFTIKSLRRFLDTVNPEAKAVIRHMEVVLMMYNDRVSNDEAKKNLQALICQRRSDAAWRSVCIRLLKECPALEILHCFTALSNKACGNFGNPKINPAQFFMGRATKHVRWVGVKARLTPDTASDAWRELQLLMAMANPQGDDEVLDIPSDKNYLNGSMTDCSLPSVRDLRIVP